MIHKKKNKKTNKVIQVQLIPMILKNCNKLKIYKQLMKKKNKKLKKIQNRKLICFLSNYVKIL